MHKAIDVREVTNSHRIRVITAAQGLSFLEQACAQHSEVYNYDDLRIKSQVYKTENMFTYL